MTEELKQRIEKIANDNDWSARFEEQDGQENIEFEGFTPVGQDLIVNIWDSPFETLADVECALWHYAEDFDPDQEAYLWLGSDGHGINGSPHYMADVLEDMVDAKQMIYDLSDAFKE